MSPVADCDLATFYRKTSLKDSLSLFRGFYGCLITALKYLHETQIRHRDIKPENILVKGQMVYLADFGISLDWEGLSRATTVDDHGKSLVYCAPEVWNHQRRNASSDIWSLGCVFFEMATILHGSDVDSMRQFFKNSSDGYSFHQNLSSAQEWSQNLRENAPSSDDVSFEWALSMMNVNPEARPAVGDLCEKILGTDRERPGTTPFVLECCAPSPGSVSPEGGDHNPEDDIWAQDHDEQFTSPLSTNPSSKASENKDKGSLDVAVKRDVVADSIPTSHEDAILETDGALSVSSESNSLSSDSSHEDAGEQSGISADFETEKTLVPDGRPADAVDSVDTVQNTEPLPKMEVSFSESEFPPPILTPESWGSPSALLEAIQSDTKFIENLTSRDLYYLRFVEEATIKDVCRLLKVLIENGLRVDDPDWVSEEGTTPLMMVVSWPFDFACVFELLVNNGADVHTRTGGGPLSEACVVGNLSAINLILDKGVDVNRSTDEKKESGDEQPLSIAVANHQFEVVELLLSRGADPNGKSGDPLLLACGTGNTNIAEALLKKGASVSRYTTYYKEWGSCEPIMVATEEDELEIVKLLLKHGANPDARSGHGATPLICACSNDYVSIAKYLLENYRKQLNVYHRIKPDPSSDSRTDVTALEFACGFGHYEIAELLLDHGVNPNHGRKFMTGGWTPLHAAAAGNELEIVQLLIARGADLTARTFPLFSGRALGHTPLSIAREYGHKKVVNALLEAAENSGWLALVETTVA